MYYGFSHHAAASKGLVWWNGILAMGVISVLAGEAKDVFFIWVLHVAHLLFFLPNCFCILCILNTSPPEVAIVFLHWVGEHVSVFLTRLMFLHGR